MLDPPVLAARLAHGAALGADRPLDALLPRVEPSLGAAIVLAARADRSSAAMTATPAAAGAELGMSAPAATAARLGMAAARAAPVALGMAAALAMAASIPFREDRRGDAKGRGAGEKQKFTHVDSPNPPNQRPGGSRRSCPSRSLRPAGSAISRPKMKLK
jgi:hypothetical protein